MKTKELIEYLQGFPEESEVSLPVIDTKQERKYAFPVEEVVVITDDDHPVIFVRIDKESQKDITKEVE